VKRIPGKSRVALALVGLVALVLVGAMPVLAASRTAGAASAAVTSHAGTRGQLTLKGTVHPLTLAHSNAATHTANASSKVTPRQMPLRLPNGKTPGQQAASVAGARAHAPVVPSDTRARVGTQLQNFDGIDEITNGATSATPLEPPDEGLGAGNGYVANFVNITGAIYHTNGTVAAGPFYLNTFFLESPTAFTSDPRVYYDASTNRWFATILELSATESHLDLAVSLTGNPTDGWLVYTIDTTDPTGFECPCFPDYPILGIDQHNVYIAPNEFSISGTAFNGAEIYAISKSQVEAGVPANFVRFGSLSIGGAPAYHVQPAVTDGSPSAEYFLNSLDPNSTFDNRLGVWALTNGASVTTGIGSPVLTSTVITSETYGFPPNAQTPPGFNSFVGESTTGIVQTDFDAMQEVQYINGHLVGALCTAVTIPGDTAERSGVAWFEVTPKLSGGVISGSSKVSHQGYISSQGQYLLYPHINRVNDGNDVIVFGLGGPGTYLSAAYAVKRSAQSTYGPIVNAGPGTGPDNGFTDTFAFGGAGRWGDYSNGEVNLSNGTVWLATQYIPNNGDEFANWGNRIFEVQL
jgi:hypothetical protein